MNLSSRPTTKTDDIENFTMRKMTIANALAPHLSEERLQEALIIWEYKYAQQPTFALQRFISEFCDNTIAGQRSKILQALFLALNNGASGKEEPIVNTPKASTQLQEATLVFEHLLSTILSSLSVEANQKVRLLVQAKLKTLKVNSILLKDFNAFFSQGYAFPPSFYVDIKVMQQCINLVYVELCDVLGPVKADNALYKAVQSIEKQHTSGFSVHELL